MTVAEHILEALERFSKNSKFLTLLDHHGMERLARIAIVQQLEPSTTVIRQGEPGDCCYLLVSGEVRVMVEEAGDKEVARLSAGNFFGEIGIVTRQPRTATVITTESSELIRLDRAPLIDILQDYPRAHEIIGRVGLRRSEANIEHMLKEDDGELGLADLLEADDEDTIEVPLEVDEG